MITLGSLGMVNHPVIPLNVPRIVPGCLQSQEGDVALVILKFQINSYLPNPSTGEQQLLLGLPGDSMCRETLASAGLSCLKPRLCSCIRDLLGGLSLALPLQSYFLIAAPVYPSLSVCAVTREKGL